MDPELFPTEDPTMAQPGQEMGGELSPEMTSDEAAASLAFATQLSEGMMTPQEIPAGEPEEGVEAEMEGEEVEQAEEVEEETAEEEPEEDKDKPLKDLKEEMEKKIEKVESDLRDALDREKEHTADMKEIKQLLEKAINDK